MIKLKQVTLDFVDRYFPLLVVSSILSPLVVAGALILIKELV